jgi:hypothetical protein
VRSPQNTKAPGFDTVARKSLHLLSGRHGPEPWAKGKSPLQGLNEPYTNRSSYRCQGAVLLLAMGCKHLLLLNHPILYLGGSKSISVTGNPSPTPCSQCQCFDQRETQKAIGN